MPTISLSRIIAEQLQSHDYRTAFLSEITSHLVSGDFDAGLNMLHEMVDAHNARSGAYAPQEVLTLGQSPSAKELFQVVGILQRKQDCALELRIIEDDELEVFEHPEPVHSAAA